ncbi:MAG: DUF2007 domain-containing protein [Bacteroidia bacterium]|jgi:hypothetical protein
MKYWTQIIAFDHSHDAYLVKTKLEAEGIEVIIKDELTSQVYYSTAVGGIKLLVRDFDYARAYDILIATGYITEPAASRNKWVVQFDKLTSKLPLVGRSIIELRFLILVAIILLIIITPIVILNIPTNTEKLTQHTWCVDRLNYKGKELTPQTTGFRFDGNSDNCPETIFFNHNGTVRFPGVNSNSTSANWEFRNDSLIITKAFDENDFVLNDSLQLKQKKEQESSIYYGTYEIKINRNLITLQSDSLIIEGRVYQSGFYL